MDMKRAWFWIIGTFLWIVICAALAIMLVPRNAHAESGIASVYAVPGRDRYAGRTMACGGKADPAALTAAHKTLPCGSRVRVTNRRNGQSVVVTIRDRGPFIRGRIIDLKPAGSRAIACGDLCPVTLTRM